MDQPEHGIAPQNPKASVGLAPAASPTHSPAPIPLTEAIDPLEAPPVAQAADKAEGQADDFTRTPSAGRRSNDELTSSIFVARPMHGSQERPKEDRSTNRMPAQAIPREAATPRAALQPITPATFESPGSFVPDMRQRTADTAVPPDAAAKPADVATEHNARGPTPQPMGAGASNGDNKTEAVVAAPTMRAANEAEPAATQAVTPASRPNPKPNPDVDAAPPLKPSAESAGLTSKPSPEASGETELAPPITPHQTSPASPSSGPAAHANDVARPTTAHAISEQLSVAVAQATDGQIEVSLAPEELGRVKLSLQHGDNGLTVLLQAERPETLELMRRNIELLHRDFRALGYEQITFDFTQNGAGQGSGFHERARPPNTEGNAAPPITPNPPGQELRPVYHPALQAGGLDIRI
ncbi:flagellar hook-length control protein FliK [Pseudothioclava arenosa]|uniref:flagellar hook-length control protein FliK n=1 Tax=Pseudothioclava arenosa TaxID=1795308 RepID=UPI0015C7C041|nr:flagellar hook-length control protein FliK [Pseudothioclava arenosa]